MDGMKIGSNWGGSGDFTPFTSSISGAQRVTDGHGRFFDPNVSGRLYHAGATIVSISNATFTIATTTNGATPIVGLWNPLNSNKNLEVLQAHLAVIMTNTTATGPGGFVWAISSGNSAISTGVSPTNGATFASPGGSVAKAFVGGQALTGLTNNLSTLRGSGLGGGSAENVSFVATAVAMQTQQFTQVENIDGSIIVPPGGVLALLATTTPVAHSAVPGISWQEVPLLITL